MAGLIGTAGHVDHGKTTLIRALTGIDTDRLPEEKRRGLTIDLGFAYVELPGVGRVSIVDVPGHERFIGNMLVGAMGVDVALLCVAADAAVMPQTIEHFQILCLLPVQRLVVALTRSDLVDDDTRSLASMEVEEMLAPTRFKGSQIVPVSAHTGAGLDDLRQALAKAVLETHSEAGGGWYLPVDRVFTVKGYGTVVTGTLVRGTVKEGDPATLAPEGLAARVRGIQCHDAPQESSSQGTRTAINLGGVRPEDVHRGQLLGDPGSVHSTAVLDARMEWLPGQGLKHGARARVSIGSDEAIARAFLNDGDATLVQFRFERNVGATKDQSLIVRKYSPPTLVGGGRVLVPEADVRRKSQKTRVVSGELSADAAMLSAVESSPSGLFTDEVCKSVGMSQQALGEPFERLKAEGRLLGFAGLWMTPTQLEEASNRLVESLKALHDATPTALSHPREQVVKKSGLAWSGKPLDRIVAHLDGTGVLRVHGTGIALAGFTPQFSGRQQELLDKTLTALAAHGLNVPSLEEVASALYVPRQAIEEIVKLAVGAGLVVRLEDGLFYPRKVIETCLNASREKFAGVQFTASEFRTAMDTTRKYAIPILEHFDAKGYTTRIGEKRVINQSG